MNRFGEWQPIETAPKDGTRVLVYQPEGFHPIEHPIKVGHHREDFPSSKLDDQGYAHEWPHDESTQTASYDAYEDGSYGAWWVGDAYDSDRLYPTHWMPLPPPPEREG